ncbi:hypothetical protein GCM10010412_002420 [Nonomuraea recticatena]|uniref:Uncharacterized protein n=1 Tax=Nonomuraea recticatena TaxID=46178 RepID=A0ABN3R5H3_9ACTN
MSLTGETLSYLSGPGVASHVSEGGLHTAGKAPTRLRDLTTLTASGADVAVETGETDGIHRESGG